MVRHSAEALLFVTEDAWARPCALRLQVGLLGGAFISPLFITSAGAKGSILNIPAAVSVKRWLCVSASLRAEASEETQIILHAAFQNPSSKWKEVTEEKFMIMKVADSRREKKRPLEALGIFTLAEKERQIIS